MVSSTIYSFGIMVVVICVVYIARQFIKKPDSPKTWEDMTIAGTAAIIRYKARLQTMRETTPPSPPSITTETSIEREAIQFKQPAVRSLFQTHIEPNLQVLISVKAWDGVVAVAHLLDTNGHFPSVQDCPVDAETQSWKKAVDGKKCYDLLRTICLAEHSVHVTKEMIAEIGKNTDIGLQLGVILVIGMGHDLGKVRELHKAHGCQGKNQDHPIVSQRIISKTIPETFPFYDQILEAIGQHHNYDKRGNKYASLLKTADQRARQKELSQLLSKETGDTPPQVLVPDGDKVDLSWIDRQKVLDMIADLINHVDEQGRYQGFSHQKIVYIQPGSIFNCIWKTANQTEHFEISGYNASKESQSKVVRAFKHLIAEWIPDHIGDEYTGRKYQIITKAGKELSPGFYLPIHMSAFSDAIQERIDARKNGATYSHAILQSILKLVPIS